MLEHIPTPKKGEEIEYNENDFTTDESNGLVYALASLFGAIILLIAVLIIIGSL